MVKTIYLARHGFRLSWETNVWTSPTGTPRDPPLAAHGLDQARELAGHIASLPASARPTAVVSSPLYRCLQTAQPTAQALALPIVVEHGVGEWYLPIKADSRTLHPQSRPAGELKQWFAEIEDRGQSLHFPSRRGESQEGCHDRAEEVLRKLIAKWDADGVETAIIFTHAATNIAMARALTGDRSMPVRSATCSLGEYHRKPGSSLSARGGLGEWERTRDGDTSFLSKGEERHWEFSYVEAYEEEGVLEDGSEVEGGLKSDAYAIPAKQDSAQGAKAEQEKGTGTAAGKL